MIKVFYLGWKSGVAVDEFVSDIRALGLSAFVANPGDADVTIVVANPPISDAEAAAYYDQH